MRQLLSRSRSRHLRLTRTIINVIGFWVTEVPLAWLLAFRAHMQVRGVFASIPIAEALIALLSLAMFLRGNWKTQKI
jgi:Na+-driven multidrug efflux pump